MEKVNRGERKKKKRDEQTIAAITILYIFFLQFARSHGDAIQPNHLTKCQWTLVSTCKIIINMNLIKIERENDGKDTEPKKEGKITNKIGESGRPVATLQSILSFVCLLQFFFILDAIKFGRWNEPTKKKKTDEIATAFSSMFVFRFFFFIFYFVQSFDQFRWFLWVICFIVIFAQMNCFCQSTAIAWALVTMLEGFCQYVCALSSHPPLSY